MKKKNKYPYSPRRLKWYLKFKDGMDEQVFSRLLTRIYKFIEKNKETNRAPLFITIFTSLNEQTEQALKTYEFIRYKNIAYAFFDIGLKTQERSTRVYIEVLPYKDFK